VQRARHRQANQLTSRIDKDLFSKIPRRIADKEGNSGDMV